MTKIDGQVMLHDPQILPKIAPHFFDVAWHEKQGGLIGRAKGRGCAYFLRLEAHEVVLRPFRRGGLIGRIVGSHYLRLGARNSRAFREFALLEWMHAKGLAVPRPVGARYAPSGLWYRADLITQFIAHSRPLADVLSEGALPAGVWSRIGGVIRKMHDLGVDHSDLNCRNILLDRDMQVWLIDFDKCQRRKKGAWAGQNLSRLRRSLIKEGAKSSAFFWSDADWPALLAGYETDDTPV